MNLVMFNTLMGVAAGLALLLVPRAWANLNRVRMPLLLVDSARVSRHGWAATFVTLGVTLTSLGFVMTIQHPLAPAKDYIDTVFGEPCLLLGLLLLGAGWVLGRHDLDLTSNWQLRAAVGPIGLVVFALGLVLLACSAAIVRFNVVGAAPVQEPITGLLHDYPMVENLFFAVVLYGLAAAGCLAFPMAVAGHRVPWQVLYWCWTVSGAGFTVFAAMNYYTHTGMLVNIGDPGPDMRW